MSRAISPVDPAEWQTFVDAIAAAGYRTSEFGNIGWDEINKEPAPNQRFVQVGRVRQGQPMSKQYECTSEGWLERALADFRSGEFGRK